MHVIANQFYKFCFFSCFYSECYNGDLENVLSQISSEDVTTKLLNKYANDFIYLALTNINNPSHHEVINKHSKKVASCLVFGFPSFLSDTKRYNTSYDNGKNF